MPATVASYADLLAALARDDVRPVRGWLSRHVVAPAGPLTADDLRVLDGVAFWNAEESEPDALGAVTRALRALAPVPAAAPLLVLYLRALCDRAWEAVWDVRPLLAVMSRAVEVWQTLPPTAGRADDDAGVRSVADPELTALCLRTLDVLAEEMATLNAGSCGGVAAWAEHARRTGELAGMVLQEARQGWAGYERSAPTGPDAGYRSAPDDAPGSEPEDPQGAGPDSAHGPGPDAVAASDDGYAAIVGYVTGLMGGTARYYRALAVAAGEVYRHFGDGDADLATAVRMLHAAEESFPDGIERAELRAHRYDVAALAAVGGRPWVRVEHGTLTYLYPFGLVTSDSGTPSDFREPAERVGTATGPSPRPDGGLLSDPVAGPADGAHAAEDTAAACAAEDTGATYAAEDTGATHSVEERLVQLAVRTAGGWTLAGCGLAGRSDVRIDPAFELDDMWQGHDPLGRRYHGMSVTLPDLLLPDPDRLDEPPLRLGVEVRLSALGNHCLRLTAPLDRADPLRMHTMMSQAAPECGDLLLLGTAIRFAGAVGGDRDGEPAPGEPAGGAAPAERNWPRLADFATDLISDVAAQLSAVADGPVTGVGRPGTYHVVLTVTRAALVPPGGGPAEPILDARTVPGHPGGQPLCHPVQHGISSLAEWLRYPTNLSQLPVVPLPGFHGDLVLRTCNTTLVFLPGTPEYMIGTVTEAAEFVASLVGMFAGWQHRIAGYYERLNAQVSEMITRFEQSTVTPGADGPSADDQRITDELAAMQAGLESERLRLHRFVMASRLSLMFVTAPSLVTSPVVRLTLDRLLAAAGFDALRAEYAGMVDEVLGDRLTTLIEAAVRRQRERDAALARAAQERRERREAAEQARQAAEREQQEHERREREERERHRQRANRRRTDVALGALAAVGLSGLMQIIQAGYSLQRWYAAALVFSVVLVAVGIGWMLHRLHPDSPSGGPDRSRPRRSRRKDATEQGEDR